MMDMMTDSMMDDDDDGDGLIQFDDSGGVGDGFDDDG